MLYENLTTEELIEKLDKENMPKHIGVIMDGNGRWAKKRHMHRNFGHQEGMKRVVEIVENSTKLGIESLSLYAFSTENWKRPEDEVTGLMKILVLYIRNELSRLNKNNVKINIMGDISKLPELPRKEVERAIELTKNNNKMTLNIGLNYGGRSEIIMGIKSFIEDYDKDKGILNNLNEESFMDYLYTSKQPELDLLIRPSGEQRLSNFMLYQVAYTEFYYSDILWPDFKEREYVISILEYQNRNRRFGGL